MNNKGQTLVIFVILIPIFFIIFSLIIDLGFLYIDKRSISNNVYSATVYYLDNMNNEDVKIKTKKLLDKNIKDADITIYEEDDYVKIKVLKERKNIFSITENKIEISYKGNKINKEIIKG